MSARRAIALCGIGQGDDRWIKLLILAIFLVATLWVTPAEAATCRNWGDRQVCITSIQRSAKNYWEYRMVMSVNGVEQPMEIVNCRDRIRVKKDGTSTSFEPNGVGEFVCRLFKQ